MLYNLLGELYADMVNQTHVLESYLPVTTLTILKVTIQLIEFLRKTGYFDFLFLASEKLFRLFAYLRLFILN